MIHLYHSSTYLYHVKVDPAKHELLRTMAIDKLKLILFFPPTYMLVNKMEPLHAHGLILLLMKPFGMNGR